MATNADTFQILIIEDDDDMANLIKTLLTQSELHTNLTIAGTLGDALSRLKAERFDLILTDLNLPASKGLDTLHAVYGAARNAPVIVLTAISEEKLGIEAIKAGAEDYLVKDETYAKLLVRSVRYSIERKGLEAQLRATSDRFAHLLSLGPGVVYSREAETPYAATFVSENIKEQTGYEPGVFTADPDFWAMRIHPEDASSVFEGMSLLRGNNRLVLEYRFRHKDGGWRWMRDEQKLLHDAAGNPEQILGCWTDITDQKQSEIEFRRSEERFRTLVDTANQGILIHRHYKPLYANQVLADMHGYSSPDEILKLQSTEVLLAPGTIRLHEPALRGEDMPLDREYKGLKKDGTEFWVLRRSFVIDWDGEPALCSMRVDITDRKAAEEELRQSEIRLRTLFDGFKQGILIHHHRKALFANQALADIYGYDSPEDILSLKTTKALISPKDRNKRDFHEARLKGKKIVPRQQYRGLKKDGSEIWVDRRAFLIDWDGEPAICSVREDCTDQKLAEQELREATAETERQRQRLADAIEGLADGFAYFDKDDRLVVFNNNFTKIRPGLEEFIKPGVSFEEIIRKNAEIGTEYDDIVRDEAWIKKRLKHHRNPKGSQLRHLHDGRILLITEYKTGDGGTVHLRTDITEQTRMEEELHQSAKMNALGQLAAGIAHNFNNLLQPILGLTERLAKTLPDDSNAREDLDMVVKASRQAKELVAQIVAFARQGEKKPEKVDAYSFVNQSLNLVRMTFPTTITLEEKLNKKTGLVFIDTTRMANALLNVITNALDAIGGKVGTITISLSPVKVGKKLAASVHDLKPGAYAKLAITDTGHGMDAETLERIFEPFFTTKENGSGTGLGLSTTYGIVASHGGAVRALSSVGKGSTVEIYLPVVDGKTLH